MFIVVSYDIRDDGRRAKVCNELKNYGEHIQYSVFECDLSKGQIEQMQASLGSLIHRTEDSIRYYSLCQICRGKTKVQGRKAPI